MRKVGAGHSSAELEAPEATLKRIDKRAAIEPKPLKSFEMGKFWCRSLEYAPEYMKSDPEVILTAAKIDWHAIEAGTAS